jgi:hypothetical protein
MTFCQTFCVKGFEAKAIVSGRMDEFVRTSIYRPLFIFRVIWLIDSFIFFVVLCVYASRTGDPMWSLIVSSSASGFLITSIVLLILVIVFTVMTDIDRPHCCRRVNFLISNLVGGCLVTLC